jgi:hypothetical protein
MTIVAATRAYEAWAGRHIDLVAADLQRKHQAMAAAPFPFLRATFYRWVALWQEACPELTQAPHLVAVGDLHVENFGTWRDAEGRLAWGINDFDEAFPMPYTIDLVRLATSAILAKGGASLTTGAAESCAQILAGYRTQLRAGTGRAFVLEEANPLLRAMALGEERDPARFWAKLTRLRAHAAPRAVRKLLIKHLPDGCADVRIVHRTAGLGSLGRPRFVAIGQAGGGLVAREAKAMLPSAYGFATNSTDDRLYLAGAVARAVRAHDPFYGMRKGWVLRRLAPHCTRIELGDFPQARDERYLLYAMGCETANVHLGSGAAIAAVRADLKRRGPHWLLAAAERMAAATTADWKAWRRHVRA